MRSLCPADKRRSYRQSRSRRGVPQQDCPDSRGRFSGSPVDCFTLIPASLIPMSFLRRPLTSLSKRITSRAPVSSRDPSPSPISELYAQPSAHPPRLRMVVLLRRPAVDPTTPNLNPRNGRKKIGMCLPWYPLRTCSMLRIRGTMRDCTTWRNMTLMIGTECPRL